MTLRPRDLSTSVPTVPAYSAPVAPRSSADAPLPSAFSIQDAVAADMPAVLAIYNAAVRDTTATYDYDPRTQAAQDQQFLARSAAGWPFLVARAPADWRGQAVPDDILGYASCGPFRERPGWRFACEHSVYVHASARGMGVGAALLAVLLGRARAHGMHTMVGTIDAENAASVALHRRLGFEEVGVMREGGYKFGRWLDVLFMSRVL